MKVFTELVNATLLEMVSKGYCKDTIGNNRRAYSVLWEFCINNGIESYSEEVGEKFLQDLQQRRPQLKPTTINNYRSYLLRLNSTLSGLAWQPRYTSSLLEYAKSCFSDLVNEYESYLYETGKTKYNVRARIHLVARFLQFAEQNGYERLSDLTAAFIYEAFQAASDKRAFRSIIGAFLRYAKIYGLVTVDLSPLLPKVANHGTVPTVYSPEEIEQLLTSIDASTSMGKRNYAIVLIAARLGLRACDIANMTLDCLCWKSNTIRLVQSKTKQPLMLPMLDDIKFALNDYINNGRPETTDSHIFQIRFGYGAISTRCIYRIVRKSFECSIIECGDRRRGSHALRSSLATALLHEGNDYHTIQKVLGQNDIQSSKSYAKADVEQLRDIALPVPLPTGGFLKLLNSAVQCRGAK